MTANQEDIFKKEIMSFETFENMGDICLSPLEDIRLEDIVLPPLPDEDEATLDAVTKYKVISPQEFPYSPLGPPETTNFPGELNFAVEINAKDIHKKKYLYSHKLNRIYVDIKCNFPVHFKWDYTAAPGPMYVRSTVVFSDKSQAEKRVERCLQHTHESTNANINQKVVKNVLHSAREMNTQGVFYCGDPSIPDSWFSVLVQLSAETGGPTHAYQFVCKNSCSTGINRRSIEIIFTLEDFTGHVYGRQTVGARVCSCLRRDLLKDEELEATLSGNKRVATKPPQTKTKRIKLEDAPANTDLLTLPQLSIVGSRSVIAGLEVMLSMQEQAASFKKNDQQALDAYNKSITDLKAAIEQLKSKQT